MYLYISEPYIVRSRILLFSNVRVHLWSTGAIVKKLLKGKP